jgi:hypothetical protein
MKQVIEILSFSPTRIITFIHLNFFALLKCAIILTGNGNIFGIKAKIEPITILGFDVNMDSAPNQTVEIYFHPGLDPGFASPQDYPYTKIFQQNVTGMGKGNVTTLSYLSFPVTIPANATYSFYITTTTTTTTAGGAKLWYNAGLAVGDIVASDQHVKIGEGYAVSYPFLSYIKRKRWNGEDTSFNFHSLSCFSTLCRL